MRGEAECTVALSKSGGTGVKQDRCALRKCTLLQVDGQCGTSEPCTPGKQ